MYIVQFSSTRVVPFQDPRAFDHRIRRWLCLREAENTYFFNVLPQLLQEPQHSRSHFFTIEEDATLLAAGALHPSGSMCLTWATSESTTLLADFAIQNHWHIKAIHAPGHTAWHLAGALNRHTRRSFEITRSEHIYQLASTSYPLPPGGRLERATLAQRALLEPWIRSFMNEAHFESSDSAGSLLDSMINAGLLYLWKDPAPVSMAAWTSPTPNGASINFVFTPEPLRGRGYGKAVSAALAAHMLASGLKHCYILTDSQDARANHIYQSIGARTVAEYLRCVIHPTPVSTPAGRQLVPSASAL